MNYERNLDRGRKIISLKVNGSLHFLAKCAALYQGVTVEELYQVALRYYLVRECGSAVKPLVKEFNPPLTAGELSLLELGKSDSLPN